MFDLLPNEITKKIINEVAEKDPQNQSVPRVNKLFNTLFKQATQKHAEKSLNEHPFQNPGKMTNQYATFFNEARRKWQHELRMEVLRANSDNPGYVRSILDGGDVCSIS